MRDYSGESPDIALLLTVAECVQLMLRELGATPEYRAALDSALKPFEHYPNPVETEDAGA